MNKKSKLRVLSIILLIVMVLTSCSRSVSLKSGNSKETTQSDASKNSKEAKAEQDAFDTYMDEIFVKEVPCNTISLHYLLAHPENFGITSYNVTLGQATKAEFDKGTTDMTAYLDKVNSFNYDLLTDKQQLTYKIVKTNLEDSLKNTNDYYYYTEYLSPLKGMQSQIPTLLSDYTFYKEKDVQDYIAILGLFPDYFKSILD